ncbi:hypothetical protein SDC9_151101 [bioreactor metagenome]|uniref:Uncharacterized protein n=1 Tax=bioreactor metagenome TaxID=1076179 RepID=A0A645EPW7_9ZZZZ
MNAYFQVSAAYIVFQYPQFLNRLNLIDFDSEKIIPEISVLPSDIKFVKLTNQKSFHLLLLNLNSMIFTANMSRYYHKYMVFSICYISCKIL